MKIEHNHLVVDLSAVHPKAKAKLAFQRTLRLPDDGKTYPLPPGLGNFPLATVDEFKARVPPEWLARGGIFFPMYQAEAMWVMFNGEYDDERNATYPMAIRIATGMRSAVTGEAWTTGLQAKDYVTIPEQPWLDGFCVKKGEIRQFVAAPLGQGFTVEAQLTGKEEFGGLQIDVYAMKREVYEKKFPIIPEDRRYHRGGGYLEGYSMSVAAASSPMRSAEAASMGLGAGGKMKQEIHVDPHGLDAWDTTTKERVFVHLCNSLAYQVTTGKASPNPPPTAAEYTRRGLPWFDHYRDDLAHLDGTPLLANLKTLTELGFQKGMQLLPAEEAPAIAPGQVTHLSPKPKAPEPGTVRDGKW
jgi:hypothetical protein